MAAIKGKDTRPEMIVRRYLHSLGLRYSLHSSKLPGHPDIVLRRLKTVVFVHGCFWHGHEGCRYFKMPKSRTEYWEKKIARNRERDAMVKAELREMGWNVKTVWECDIRRKDRRMAVLYALGRELLDLRDHRSGEYVYDDGSDLLIAAEASDRE